jgi:hypothetical protein
LKRRRAGMQRKNPHPKVKVFRFKGNCAVVREEFYSPFSILNTA